MRNSHADATELFTPGLKLRFQARNHHSAPLRKSALSAAKDYARIDKGMDPVDLMARCARGERLDD